MQKKYNDLPLCQPDSRATRTLLISYLQYNISDKSNINSFYFKNSVYIYNTYFTVSYFPTKSEWTVHG